MDTHWLFDLSHYQRQFARHYGREFAESRDGDAYAHFLRAGQFEGLSGHLLFDPEVYRDMASYDVAGRISHIGPFSTFLLHCAVPRQEPVASHFFDPSWYLRRYPDAARAVATGRFVCALHHYLSNETPAAFDPSPRFSEALYLAEHQDVAAGIAAGHLRNGLAHFLAHGRAENRRFFPAGDEARPVLLPEIAARVEFPLQSRAFSQVTLLPCQRDGAGAQGHSFGVLDREGEPIRAFAHPWFAMRAAPENVPTDPRTFIYGGVLMDHFGHVLRDSLATLWFLRAHPTLPVLWHWIDLPVPHSVWPGWLEELWGVLGLEQRQHVRILKPMRVARLILPEPGLVAPDLLHESQVEALAVRPAPAAGGRRVWLSRRRLPENFGRLAGEAELETILHQRGWEIIWPESLPVSAKVDLFASSAVVAGCMASAFHAALLSVAPRAKLILVKRPGIGREFYDGVARARGLEQHYVDPPLKPYANPTAWTTFELSDPLALADAICATAR